MSYKEKIQSEIKKALSDNGTSANPLIERTKLKQHGDVATNIAMILAKEFKKNPLDIANEIKDKVKSSTDLLSYIEVVKPGFINMTVSDYALAESLSEVYRQENVFGFASPKSKGKVLVEYVSANPTGDLHLGHGRQAAIGSCLVNLLEAAGFETVSEFYINDYGEQIQKLSDTAFAIYKKIKGETVEWKEDFYPEEGISPYVKKILENKKDLSRDELGQYIKDLILKSQEALLSSCKVTFNKWFSETELHKNKSVDEVLKKLKEGDWTYEHEGALWFKAKEFGDVRDRVLVRSDGRPTYLVADIAYHINKLNRSDFLVTIWGADHHGQEISLKGGLKALGYDVSKLEIIFVQLVSLKKDGQEVKMSKRTGAVIAVEELLSEVGSDAFRYFLSESHPDHRIVFDVDLAKKQDKDNPVYYIQYAHARCCSIFRQIGQAETKIDIEEFKNLVLKKSDPLMEIFKANNNEYAATKDLILRILDFPEEVENAAITRSPSRIANYLKDLATEFHQFYTVCRVISNNSELTKARLMLVEAVKITITNGLKILGITAPESM